MCKHPGSMASAKKVVVRHETMDELLAWYEDVRRDIEVCPEAQRPVLLRQLDQRFREEELRLRGKRQP